MAVKKSLSLSSQCDIYFDGLVKSRFIEMFGNPLSQTSEYEYVSIKSFSKCVVGATPSTLVEEYWNDGTIPWLSSGEVNQGRIYSTEKKITQKGYDKCSTHIVPAHTVLIALAGQGKTRGTVAVTEIELCTNQSICSIITDKTIEADYLYQALKIQYDRIRSMSNGDGGRGSLNLEIVGKITVPKPPIELQQQFAHFVHQVDKSKVICKQLITGYEEVLKSRFIEMFGDPIVNEKSWSTISLGKVTSKIGSGLTPSGGKASYIGTDIALVRSMNVHDSLFDYDDLAYITEEQAEQLSNVVLRRSDVLLNITGASVARCCVVPDDVLPARVNQHVCIIRTDPNVLDPCFLNYLLISDPMKAHLLNISKANGATREAITKKMIEGLHVILPPISVQREFVEFADKVTSSKNQLRSCFSNAVSEVSI